MADFFNGGFLAGKKTYITAATGIISAVAAYLIGEMDLVQVFQTIAPLVSIIFLRKSINS